MLNLLTKTKPWMVASLLVATSIFGQNACAKPCPPKPCPPKPCPQPCPQPCPPTQMCDQDPCCPAWPTPVLNAAYNYPARIQTRCPWDFFAYGSFLYWQPIQENMDLAFRTVASDDPEVFVVDGSYINMDFSYKPGFKVGIGMDFAHDNWDSSLEYTWFHSSHSQSASVGLTEHLLALRGNPTTLATAWNSISQKWRLNMDFLDLDLGRTYYVGTKLTFRSAFGARGTWIRQRLYSSFANSVNLTEASATQKSNAWAVGPRASLKTNWNIGEGFRAYGNGALDILYTRYTKLTDNTSMGFVNAATPIEVTNFSQSKLGYLRPHTELVLGIGWGTYLDCNNWYMDFSADYGFQVFWNQNMFRHLTGLVAGLVPTGDLFVHGLTATFRLDF